MVFTSALSCVRRSLGNRGPDPFWKRRQIFSLSGHLYGRHRNCYKFAVRGVLKMLKRSTIGRRYKKKDITELRELRVNSGAREHGLSRIHFVEGIQRCLILLNRKILADLAIWEPRTFKALTDVAKTKILVDGDLKRMDAGNVSHFVRKDYLKENESQH